MAGLSLRDARARIHRRRSLETAFIVDGIHGYVKVITGQRTLGLLSQSYNLSIIIGVDLALRPHEADERYGILNPTGQLDNSRAAASRPTHIIILGGKLRLDTMADLGPNSINVSRYLVGLGYTRREGKSRSSNGR